nr:TrbC/VirB2 family protein [Parasphingopyxis lamellibrachiae]
MSSTLIGPASTSSLFAGRQDSVLLTAASWIEGTLLGALATIVAVLAVAGIGLLMLQGRLVLRDGARVLIGCFILFGASSIASGLRSFADQAASGEFSSRLEAQQASAPELLIIPENDTEYDPYAGASVQDR